MLDNEVLFFATACLLENRIYWIVNTINEHDEIVLSSQGKILSFCDESSLEEYVINGGQRVALRVEVNLDQVRDWISSPDPNTINCLNFLTAWDLFVDLAFSAKLDLRDRDRKANKVHEKLFWGTNPPALTPEGESYAPLWTESDVSRLRTILRRGLTMFVSRLPVGTVSCGPAVCE